MSRRPAAWPRLRDALRSNNGQHDHGRVIDVDGHQVDRHTDDELFDGPADRFPGKLAEVIDLNPHAIQPAGVDEVGDRFDWGGADEYADQPEPAKPVVTVDGVVGKAPKVVRPRQPEPIVPDWLKSWPMFTAMVAITSRAVLRSIGFHLARLPKYYAKFVLARALIGLGMTLGEFWRWFSDADARQAIRLYLETKDNARYERARDLHRSDLRNHIAITTISLAVTAGAGLVAWVRYPIWWYWAAAGFGLVLPVLGWIGRDRERPKIRAVVYNRSAVLKPTPDLVTSALGKLGIKLINDAIKQHPENPERAIGFLGPPRRHGKGWKIEIDLPAGTTAAQVIANRKALASGLGRNRGCVWPEGVENEAESRLSLYVSDRSLNELGDIECVYAKAGHRKVSVFDPIEIGLNQRGEPVTITLMFASGVIGAIPRMGKTFILRLLILIAALDPRCKIFVFNLKGGADFNAARHFAHRYRSGVSDDDFRSALAALREIQNEVSRRNDLLEDLALANPEICPEGKLTDELASMPELGLEPILLAGDEVQQWFQHKIYGTEFADLVEDIARRGPSVGVMTWLATQKISARSIPTDITDIALLRIALKVVGQIPNDQILGTGMYKAGFQANMFSRRDKGIAWLVGEDDDPVIVKAAFVDGVDAEDMAKRAQALRQSAGLLTGVAAGEDTDELDTDLDSVLDHVHSIWPSGQDNAHSVDLATRLSERWPDVYPDMDAGTFGRTVKLHGLETTTVSVAGGKAKGIKHTALIVALAHQHGTTSDPDLDEPESADEAWEDDEWGNGDDWE